MTRCCKALDAHTHIFCSYSLFSSLTRTYTGETSGAIAALYPSLLNRSQLLRCPSLATLVSTAQLAKLSLFPLSLSFPLSAAPGSISSFQLCLQIQRYLLTQKIHAEPPPISSTSPQHQGKHRSHRRRAARRRLHVRDRWRGPRSDAAAWCVPRVGR